MTRLERETLWKDASVNLGLGYEDEDEDDPFRTCAARNLDTVLGVTYYRDWLNAPEHGERPLPEEMKNLLRLLAGPHAQTILKIYKARKLEPA